MSRFKNSIPLLAMALLPYSLAANDAAKIVGRLSDGTPPSTASKLNEHLFLDDDNDIKPDVDPSNLATRVEYDGMTVRLCVHAVVTPNETHRVRIVIADVNDDQFDSGLFIGSEGVRTVFPSP